MIRLVAFGEGARHLQAVDDPHRPVEPAPLRLGVGVGADEKGRPGVSRAAEHGSDPVDAGVEPRLTHPLAQPVPRLDVDRAERRADNPDPVGAEFAKSPEVAEQAVRVDGDVGGARWRAHLRSWITMSRNSSDAAHRRMIQTRGAVREKRRTGVPRLFVGLELPESLKQAIAGLQCGLRDARWLDEDGLHLTLAFIGDVDGSARRRIEEALSRVEAPSLDIELHGLGHFPHRGPPRVLWTGAVPRWRRSGSLASAVRREPLTARATRPNGASSPPTSPSPGFVARRRRPHFRNTLARTRSSAPRPPRSPRSGSFSSRAPPVWRPLYGGGRFSTGAGVFARGPERRRQQMSNSRKGSASPPGCGGAPPPGRIGLQSDLSGSSGDNPESQEPSPPTARIRHDQQRFRLRYPASGA